MRKALVVSTVAASVVGLALTAAPAGAADAGTLVTLSVGVGVEGLAIAAPTAVVVPGDIATAAIATTVTDTRVLNTAGWTVTIRSTDLVLTGATTPGTAGTIPVGTMTAFTGDVSPTVPGVATINGDILSDAPLTLSGNPQSFVVASSRSNINTAIYTATVQIPTAGKTAGVYTGTVTQSVS